MGCLNLGAQGAPGIIHTTSLGHGQQQLEQCILLVPLVENQYLYYYYKSFYKKGIPNPKGLCDCNSRLVRTNTTKNNTLDTSTIHRPL